MKFQPFVVARWGLYLASGVAVMSIWLGHQAGASLDFLMLRSVFVFVIVTALAFAAEAILSIVVTPAPQTERPIPAAELAPAEDE
ncbi:MAG: hypothetical protein ACKVT1_09830 [Dehalococcoidia bacterium]